MAREKKTSYSRDVRGRRWVPGREEVRVGRQEKEGVEVRRTSRVGFGVSPASRARRWG